jgi:hypothetical protein
MGFIVTTTLGVSAAGEGPEAKSRSKNAPTLGRVGQVIVIIDLLYDIFECII